MSFLEIRASKSQLNETRAKLHEIIQSLAAATGGAPEREKDAEERRYRLTLAYFPWTTPGTVFSPRADPVSIDSRGRP